jgi:hypothetical protein
MIIMMIIIKVTQSTLLVQPWACRIQAKTMVPSRHAHCLFYHHHHHHHTDLEGRHGVDGVAIGVQEAQPDDQRHHLL